MISRLDTKNLLLISIVLVKKLFYISTTKLETIKKSRFSTITSKITMTSISKRKLNTLMLLNRLEKLCRSPSMITDRILIALYKSWFTLALKLISFGYQLCWYSLGEIIPFLIVLLRQRLSDLTKDFLIQNNRKSHGENST